MKLRCSSIPRLLACPASQLAEGPNFGSVEASLGSSVHAALATAIRDNGVPFYRDSFGLKAEDMDDFDYLCGRGMAIWQELRAGLTSYDCEIEGEVILDVTKKLTLSGHIDLLGVGSDYLLVCDWKTGVPDITDYWPQMRAYCLLALEREPDKHQVKCVIAWLRSSEVEVKVFTRKDLEDWKEEVLEILDHKGTYNPGQACRYCPAALDCVPRRKIIQATTTDLLALDNREWAPAKIADAWERVGLIEKAIFTFKAAVKDHVRDHGPLPLPGGGVLALSAEEKETIKLTSAAYNVLTEVLGGNPVDLMGDGLTIGKTKLGELVKKKAPRGEKGKAIDVCLDKLRACGAVSVSKFDVLKAKKGGSNAG
jgi:hypothetical protein